MGSCCVARMGKPPSPSINNSLAYQGMTSGNSLLSGNCTPFELYTRIAGWGRAFVTPNTAKLEPTARIPTLAPVSDMTKPNVAVICPPFTYASDEMLVNLGCFADGLGSAGKEFVNASSKPASIATRRTELVFIETGFLLNPKSQPWALAVPTGSAS